jgi:hypothetical protein
MAALEKNDLAAACVAPQRKIESSVGTDRSSPHTVLAARKGFRHGKNIAAPVTPAKAIAVAAIVCLMAPLAKADTWRGTAPFCNGQCQPGETQIATSKSGDGATCWTGQKVLCRNATPSCNAAQTQTSCYGVVLVCTNGFYSAPDVWHACSTFACGLCFGFGSW